MERKKIYVGQYTIIDGHCDEAAYNLTYSFETLQTAIDESLKTCKGGWWYAGDGDGVSGENVDWRILPHHYELLLVGFIDEPEDEWKARVEKEQEKKRKEEEKERKKLKELMKKYPDMLENKQ